MNIKDIAKGAGIAVGLAAWCTMWLGGGWIILNKMFPEEAERQRKREDDDDLGNKS